MAPKSLVIAEKPSVGKEIAKVLGARQNAQGYIEGPTHIVTWALGHLVTLADPEEYSAEYKSWKLETLPMLPEKMNLVVIKQTSSQYRVVQSLLRRPDVGDIIIATDAGREGELVARWILMKAGCRKPTKRLWISSQTAKAMKDGFANLKPGGNYDNLYMSAQARAEADWLVGLNVTRALTCKYNAQLSAGRVQTPTLALIVAREQDIQNFMPKEYYTIKAKFPGFTATWADSKMQSRLFDQKVASDILTSVSGKPAQVVEVSKQFKYKAPPAAYDLTELQRDANKKYAYSAKETLSYMQALYERHKLLTYPRTDSRYITEDVAATLPERLRSIAFGQYKDMASAILKAPISTKHIVNSSKVTDHHAIIPTEEAVNLAKLSAEEKNIYDLVIRRFLAVLSAPFEYEETKLVIAIGKEKFHASGKVVKSLGWKSIYSKSTALDDDDDDSQMLPQIKQGDKLDIISCGIEKGMTKPPARYTEATLLSAMENPKIDDKSLNSVLESTSGLGTPATRADIIEKLFSSFYVERRGKEIVPTSKGIQLISIVPVDLKSAELTAKWEQELSMISRGMSKSTEFISGMRKYTTKLVSSVVASNHAYHHDNQTKEKCPDCGKFLLAVNGKRGKMMVCPDRECGYRKSTSIQTNARCPNCHKKLEIRGEGDNSFFHCVCGHRERVSDFEKKRTDSGANKRAVEQYMKSQPQDSANFALADALAKWKEKSKE